MDDVVIRTVDGLLHGRAYCWFGCDLLAVDGQLTPAEQRRAVEDAFAEARARSLAASSTAA